MLVIYLIFTAVFVQSGLSPPISWVKNYVKNGDFPKKCSSSTKVCQEFAAANLRPVFFLYYDKTLLNKTQYYNHSQCAKVLALAIHCKDT